MRQQGTNIVHGGVNGNNNQFNNQNYNIQNNSSDGNRKGSNNDPLTIGLGAIAITIMVAVTFLRYFEEIYFWLWIGALASAALPFLVSVALMRDNDFVFSRAWPALLGAATGCAAMLMVTKGYTAITPDMLQLANYPGHDFDVWGRFSSYGHRVIGENMVTVACLSSAIVLNILMSLHTLFATLARTEQIVWLDSLANFMRAFRAKQGGAFAAFLVGVAYLVLSGVWFDLMSRAQ